VSPPDPETAGLRGLTFDTLNRVFWTLDTNNDRLLRIDLTGATTAVPLPGDEPPETVLRGDGLCFELEDTTGDPRVLVAHGDIFKMNPSRLLQLTLDGSVTGIEVPLDKVSFPDIRGFQTFRIGNQRRVAVVTGGGKIVQIEQVVPKPAPPSLLKCAVTLTNKVDLTWDNNGSGAGSRYLGEIIVLRNGVPFTTIPGDATSYIDATPLQGTSRYSLQASDTPGGPFSPPGSECQVTVGAGSCAGSPSRDRLSTTWRGTRRPARCSAPTTSVSTARAGSSASTPRWRPSARSRPPGRGRGPSPSCRGSPSRR
jgi:hypothetical protein